MRNLKRVLSLALALVMVLGMMVIGTSAATFTDEESITYKEAVEVMSGLGILNGYKAADGTYSFNPTGSLERDEAAKIIAYVAMGADVDEYLAPTEPYFTDIADSWAAKYINVLVNLKVVDGNGDGTYNPDGKLTVAQFAKMLLLAAGVEGTFTGPEWKANVKEAFNAEAVLKATGLKITDEDPYITREEACHMALAAMKVGTEKVEYVVWDDSKGVEANEIEDDEIISVYDNIRDAALDANLFGVDYKKVTTPVCLLSEIHKVAQSTEVVYDVYGRPGYSYSWGEGDDAVVMYYANKALATFEGPVAQKAIFAASKYAVKDATEVAYELYQDSADLLGSFTAAKDNKDSLVDEQFAAGTGYGIKTELYKVGNVYRMVAIREYLGKVTDVTPANPEVPTSKRTITIQVYNLPANNDTDGYVTLATEEYAEDDMVIVTVAGNTVKTIALAETVKGTATKIVTGSGSSDNKIYTIAGEEYVLSQNAYDVSVTVDGKDSEYYLDSFGNLIGEVSVDTPENPYIYGIVLGKDGKLWVKAGVDTSILGREEEKGQAAAEVIEILTAAGEKKVYNTDWTYTYTDATKTVITGVDFKLINNQIGTAASDADWADADTNTADKAVAANNFVKFKLDEYGCIDTSTLEVIDATSAGAGAELKAGVATIGNLSKVITDNTVFFLWVDDNDGVSTDEKWVAYTGYKTVPGVKTFDAIYTVDGKIPGTNTDDGTYAIVVIAGDAVEPDVEIEYNKIYFADTAYTTEWDATANKGKGAAVYVYENIYLDGVKTTVTFSAVQSKAVAGEMYNYYINPANGAMVINYLDNLLLGAEEVVLVNKDFFVTDEVTYIDADTVYYQITNTGLTKVEGLPAQVKSTQSIYVCYTAPNANEKIPAVSVVYFYVAETVEVPTATATWNLEAAEGDKYYVRMTFAAGAELPAGATTVVLKDENGAVIATATSIADHTVAAGRTLDCPFWGVAHESDNWTAGHQNLGADFQEDVAKVEVYFFGMLAATYTISPV